MSDEQKTSPEPKPTPRQRKPVPRWMVFAALAVALLLAFGIQDFLADRRLNKAREEAMRREVTALSVTLEDDLLRPDVAKLRRLAVKLAERAGYVEVSFADATGRVIASTDRTREGKELGEPPLEVDLGSGTAYRAVALGGSSTVGGVLLRDKR